MSSRYFHNTDYPAQTGKAKGFAIVFMLALSAFLCGGISQARAAEGHVTGRVTDADGNAVQDISVTAQRWNGSWWEWKNSASTDASGDYDISGLDAGDYQIEFSDSSGSYAHEYYNDAALSGSAESVSLSADGTTSGIDAQLAAGGSITGTIADANGTPLSGIKVSIHQQQGAGEWRTDYTASDENGTYTAKGLNTEEYRLEFSDDNHVYASEFYQDAPDKESAQPVTAAAGSTVSDIDVVLAQGGHISGTLTNAEGNSLPDIAVSAYRWKDNWWEEQWENKVNTDSSGNYTLTGLADGRYRVGFKDSTGTSAYGYSPDVSHVNFAADVEISNANQVAGINGKLAVAGRLIGTVTGPDGETAAGLNVTLYQWNGSWWSYHSSISSAGSNSYEFGGLRKDTDYRIKFEDTSGSYASEYHFDAPNVNIAHNVQIPAAVNARLAKAGHITGKITDMADNPLADIPVSVHRWNGSSWYSNSNDNTYSDSSGDYDLDPLGSGVYRVGFASSSKENYTEEYYPNASSVDSAGNVMVTAGETVSGINARLAPGGAVSGTVSDANSNPLSSVSVSAYRQEGVNWVSNGYANTNTSGSYQVNGLVPGTYRIHFSPQGKYIGEYYQDAPDRDTGTDVTVTSGNTTAGIDAQLAQTEGQTGTISGMVTSDGTAPVNGVYVTAHRQEGTSWHWAASTISNASGRYLLQELIPGTYRIGIQDKLNCGYLNQYYSDAWHLDTAADIPLAAGETVSPDTRWNPVSGGISGVLSGADNNPLMGIQVSAWQQRSDKWNKINSAVIDTDGSYRLCLPPGTYRVKFSDGSGRYAEAWHNDAADKHSAADVTVTSAFTDGIDGRLFSIASGAGSACTIPGGRGIDLSLIPVADGSLLDEINSTFLAGLPPLTQNTDGLLQITLGAHYAFLPVAASQPATPPAPGLYPYPDNALDFVTPSGMVVMTLPALQNGCAWKEALEAAGYTISAGYNGNFKLKKSDGNYLSVRPEWLAAEAPADMQEGLTWRSSVCGSDTPALAFSATGKKYMQILNPVLADADSLGDYLTQAGMDITLFDKGRFEVHVPPAVSLNTDALVRSQEGAANITVVPETDANGDGMPDYGIDYGNGTVQTVCPAVN
ncbi:MAG: carboxypeptidase regulatory-like domain-containing protein [Gammaproteobacteria bacterium]|nr:carboxypeptidase regulatory-like domain-containing protein [Gammaproteobacteria bacterium]